MECIFEGSESAQFGPQLCSVSCYIYFSGLKSGAFTSLGGAKTLAPECALGACGCVQWMHWTSYHRTFICLIENRHSFVPLECAGDPAGERIWAGCGVVLEGVPVVSMCARTPWDRVQCRWASGASASQQSMATNCFQNPQLMHSIL